MEQIILKTQALVRSYLKRKRQGAAVLETILLIIVAVVIIGAIIVLFVGKNTQGGLLKDIGDAIRKILDLNPLNSTTPSAP
ncbi:MAG: hypothetical protein QXJ06_03715 [Candidatus Aenigmatarchaeota archaeon]